MVIKEQPTKTAIEHVCGLLNRLVKLYQIPGFDEITCLLLAEWVIEKYPFETLETVTKCLSNPPRTSEKNWRLTPDTIQEWMEIYKTIPKPGKVYEVTDPGPISEETQKMLNEIVAGGIKEIPSVSKFEISKAKDRPKHEAVSRGYKFSTEEDHRLYDLRIEYSRTYHHPHTGARMDNWISWEEFLQSKS